MHPPDDEVLQASGIRPRRNHARGQPGSSASLIFHPVDALAERWSQGVGARPRSSSAARRAGAEHGAIYKDRPCGQGTHSTATATKPLTKSRPGPTCLAAACGTSCGSPDNSASPHCDHLRARVCWRPGSRCYATVASVGCIAAYLLGLCRGDDADRDEVGRVDEAVVDADAACPHDRVAEPHGPVVLDQQQRCGRVVRDLSRTSQASSSENTSTPSSAAPPHPAPRRRRSPPRRRCRGRSDAATLLPSSIASSLLRLLRCITSISPWRPCRRRASRSRARCRSREAARAPR